MRPVTGPPKPATGRRALEDRTRRLQAVVDALGEHAARHDRAPRPLTTAIGEFRSELHAARAALHRLR